MHSCNQYSYCVVKLIINLNKKNVFDLHKSCFSDVCGFSFHPNYTNDVMYNNIRQFCVCNTSNNKKK